MNKSICLWVSGRNLKNVSKFAGKSPCWGPLIVKLQHVMAYKRLIGQLYQQRDAYRRLLHNYFLQILKTKWTQLLTPLRDCLWNNVKKRVCFFEFSCLEPRRLSIFCIIIQQIKIRRNKSWFTIKPSVVSI